MYKLSKSLVKKMSEEEKESIKQELRSIGPFGKGVLDEDVGKYVKFENGSAKVDWKGFVKLGDKPGWKEQELYSSVIDCLYNLNVLNFSRKYFVNRGGVCVNPRKHNGPVLYFQRRGDAVEYAGAEKGDSTNSVSVAKDV